MTNHLAVVGSGYWGRNLIRIYHSLGSLGIICDKNETVLQGFQEQYPDIETCLAYSEILSRENIQGVVIATPAETHYSLVREALLAGKHVYVEKPLVLEETSAKELIELARDRDRVLMVGHLLQYHPVFDKLRELAATGELGRINYIYSNRLNLGKIRREENILWSFAPHDISMILTLAGEEPENVQATGGYYLHKKIADVTTTHLEFPSGLKAHIFVSWLHPFKEQKLVVVGDKKMAVFDDTQAWEDKLLLYPHEIRWESNIPVPSKADPQRVVIPQAEPLKVECEHFLSCISHGQRPRTDGREGLRVLRVLNAAQEALDNSQGPRAEGQGPSTKGPEQKSKDKQQITACPVKQHAVLPDEDRGFTGDNASQLTDNTSQIPDYFAHESTYIDEPAEVGSGTKIWHFSHVLKNSRIGENCNIGQNVVIGPDVEIGHTCKIQNNVSVYKGVTLEDGVFCGPSVVFTNIFNPRAEIRKMDQIRPILVRHGATLGANCTIVCGVTIGRYAFVGAGAVVTRDVSDYALVVGNPARQIGWMCWCGGRLDENLVCPQCNTQYSFDAESQQLSVNKK